MLSEGQILYGTTDTLPQGLGLNLCIIIAKYYIYIPSENEEDYFLDAFLAFLRNKTLLKLAKQNCCQAVNILSTFPQFFFSWVIRM